MITLRHVLELRRKNFGFSTGMEMLSYFEIFSEDFFIF